MKVNRPSYSVIGSFCLLFAICLPAVATTLFDSGNVTISSGDPTQLGRLARAVHNPSDWSSTTAFPGTANAGTTYHYRTFFIPASSFVATPFLQVNITDPGPVNLGPFVSAYLDSYDPTNPSNNYLGDEGFSGNFPGDPSFFQLLIPAGHNVVLVANGTQGGAGGANDVGKPYRILAEGFTNTLYNSPAVPTPTPTPKPTPPAISIAVSPASIKEGKNTTFTFTANPASHPAITVNYTTSGTASNGSDYTLSGSSGHVSIPVSAATATVTLHSLVVHDGSRTATLTVTGGTGYTVGSPNTVSVVIKDF